MSAESIQLHRDVDCSQGMWHSSVLAEKCATCNVLTAETQRQSASGSRRFGELLCRHIQGLSKEKQKDYSNVENNSLN